MTDMIKKAAQEQNQINQNPPPTDAPEPVVDPKSGLMHAPGAEGGFSAPAPRKKPPSTTPTSAASSQATPTTQEAMIADIRAKLAQLEGGTVPQTTPAAQTPTASQPAAQPRELPDNSSRGGRGTLIFGSEAPATTPATTPVSTPDVNPTPAETPPTARPSESRPPAGAQQPPNEVSEQQNLIQVGNNYAYVAQSSLFPGMALVLDNVQQKELDQYSFMASYLSMTFPESMPTAHPGALLRFALDHLLYSIRKDTAEYTVCARCDTKFNIMDHNCPKCNNVNRCPTCHRIYGDNYYE